MLESHGVSRMLISFHEIIPGYVFSGILVADTYLQEHPEDVRAFLRGYKQSIQFIEEHEEKARAHIPKYTAVDYETAMKSALRKLTDDGREHMDILNYQKKLMIEYGFLNEDVSLKEIVDYSYLPPVAGSDYDKGSVQEINGLEN